MRIDTVGIGMIGMGIETRTQGDESGMVIVETTDHMTTVGEMGEDMILEEATTIVPAGEMRTTDRLSVEDGSPGALLQPANLLKKRNPRRRESRKSHLRSSL